MLYGRGGDLSLLFLQGQRGGRFNDELFAPIKLPKIEPRFLRCPSQPRTTSQSLLAGPLPAIDVAH